MEPSITMEGVTAGYRNEIVFRDLSLRLDGRGLILIIGPNGSGKTTLLKTILGLLPPLRGRVLINGVDVTGRPEVAGRFVGYVPQMMGTYSSFPVNVEEVVESALVLRFPPPRVPTPGRLRHLVENAMKLLGIWEIRKKPLRDLSGGQRQKTFIARALVWDPDILFMDEPLSAVDPRGRGEIVDLIGRLRRDKLVLVTSHDISLFMEHVDRVMLVSHGVVAYGSPEEVLRPELLRRIYGRGVTEVGGRVHVSDRHIPRS